MFGEDAARAATVAARATDALREHAGSGESRRADVGVVEIHGDVAGATCSAARASLAFGAVARAARATQTADALRLNTCSHHRRLRDVAVGIDGNRCARRRRRSADGGDVGCGGIGRLTDDQVDLSTLAARAAIATYSLADVGVGNGAVTTLAALAQRHNGRTL